MDPEATRFVAGGGHHATFAGSADGDRLAPQLRIVALLDRGIEGVHVDVDDLAGPFRPAGILTCGQVTGFSDMSVIGLRHGTVRRG